MISSIDNLSLGKKSKYSKTYDPGLLQAIPRSLNRDKLNISSENLPFNGYDLWNMYEISFLNNRNKPVSVIGLLKVPSSSLYIVESKSLKLYLNSLNFTTFSSLSDVEALISKDLSELLQSDVCVQLSTLNQSRSEFNLCSLEGLCVDDLDINIDTFDYEPSILKDATNSESIEEQIYTNLMKSNCLVTGQPDWGTLYIKYKGKQISHEKFLKYIISFRNHNEFHEMCVERIFCDLMKYCKPEKLTVYARYTRRGGIDINPFRSNFESDVPFQRLVRQ